MLDPYCSQALAHLADDPDAALPQLLRAGVPLGVDEPIAPSPDVFPPKLHFKHYEDEGVPGEERHPNYITQAADIEMVRKIYEEDVALGMMTAKRPLSEVRKRYGTRLAIAAIGTVDKDLEGNKRVIHDGTHVVRVNQRISKNIKDALQHPGAAEAKRIQAYSRQRDKHYNGVRLDVKKAHRRILVSEDDWGFQATDLDNDGTVQLNTVGTFGIASAGLWWQRTFALLCRLTFHFLGNADWWQLAYCDDLNWSIPTANFWVILSLLLLWHAILGTPFAWNKFEIGAELPWVGFAIDYNSWRVGLGHSRAEWLVKWIDGFLSHTAAKPADLEDMLGRLMWASQVYDTLRPLLQPLYRWFHCAAPRALLPIPTVVRLVLNLWRNRLADPQARWVECHEWIAAPGVWRTDASATGDEAVVAGWLDTGGETQSACWFAERISPALAPWAFEAAGDSKRRIASLEMLATLLCFFAFAGKQVAGQAQMLFPAATDNQGNSFAVTKLYSPSWPLAAFVCELAAQLHARQVMLHLEWVRRDSNKVADSLTNNDFTGFRSDNRVHLDLTQLDWICLPELLAAGAPQVDKKTSANIPQKLHRKKKRRMIPGWNA